MYIIGTVKSKDGLNEANIRINSEELTTLNSIVSYWLSDHKHHKNDTSDNLYKRAEVIFDEIITMKDSLKPAK